MQTPADRLKVHPNTHHGFDYTTPKLSLLIPATRPNKELCKCLLSALLLNYQTPILINWGKTYDETVDRHNGTHIAKISGTYDYLRLIKPHQTDDLVLMIDGYDLWFQLRPDVLISRWRSINRDLLQRAIVTMGDAAVAAEGITQNILFSAEKNCGPNVDFQNEIACYAQPESPLATDLFGNDTDMLDPDTRLPLHMRPSFLNSGFIMGQTHAMRKMFRQAGNKIAARVEHRGSDQHIFNEIYGEQEYQRAVMRERHLSLSSRLGVAFRKFIGTHIPSIIDPHPDHKHMASLPGHPLEFGIGLDYGLDLVQSASLSEWDGRFFTYNDSVLLENLQLLELQYDPSGLHAPNPPRVTALPQDIVLSRPLPLPQVPDHAESQSSKTKQNGVEYGDSEAQSWTSVPLYTNIWTASVPVTIHMNGFKTMRGAIWDHMWFWERSRELLAARLMQTSGVIANDTIGAPILWEDACKQYEDEILPKVSIDT